MGARDFARRVSACLGQYLPGRRDPGPNTIASYRDMPELPVTYLGERGRRPEGMSMDDLARGEVEGHVAWPAARGRPGGTASQRLCAIKASASYARAGDPARMLRCQRVLAMRQGKKGACRMVFPGREGLAAILRDPDAGTARGRRDMVPLAPPYDSGARVSELCGLTLRDVRLDGPAVVIPKGRGRRARVAPPMGGTAGLVARYLEETCPERDAASPGQPPLPGPEGMPPARAGVSDIVARHVRGARESGADVPEGVAPHSFRHQRAIDLSGSGASLAYIRDFLGHGGVTTTETYATVSIARRREVLERAAAAPTAKEYPDWSEDRDLIAWLKGLC